MLTDFLPISNTYLFFEMRRTNLWGSFVFFRLNKQVVTNKLHQTSAMVELGPELSALNASSEAGEGRNSAFVLGCCLLQV